MEPAGKLKTDVRRQMMPDEVRAEQLAVMDAIVEFCDAAKLSYSLAYGSLLGAVRHEGFIPWDDDIDLWMSRSDYERFIIDFVDFGSRRGLTVHSVRTDQNWHTPFVKVSSDRTLVVESIDSRSEWGVCVDIFPLDSIPPSRARRWMLLIRLEILRKLLLMRWMQPREGRARWKRVIRGLTYQPLRLISSARLASLWDRVANRPPAVHGAEALEGVLVGPASWCLPRALTESSGRVSFEGRVLRAPADADAVLARLYGDYMTPPPAGKQSAPHVTTSWWRG